MAVYLPLTSSRKRVYAVPRQKDDDILLTLASTGIPSLGKLHHCVESTGRRQLGGDPVGEPLLTKSALDRWIPEGFPCCSRKAWSDPDCAFEAPDETLCRERLEHGFFHQSIRITPRPADTDKTRAHPENHPFASSRLQRGVTQNPEWVRIEGLLQEKARVFMEYAMKQNEFFLSDKARRRLKSASRTAGLSPAGAAPR